MSSNGGAAVMRQALMADLRRSVKLAKINTKQGSKANINKSLEEYYSRSCHLCKDILLQASSSYWAVFQASAATSVTALEGNTSLEDIDSCQICYEAYPESQLNRICQNGGAYCRDCITTFLENDIRVARVHEHGCECICRSCNNFFSEDIIKDFVSAETLVKFVQFRDAKLVLENPLKVYCPNRGCSKVVTISEGSSRAKCSECKTKFCTKCSSEHSSFLSCDWATDSEFRDWKRKTESGCKRCPGCSMFIEKNGGCNHMTCNRCHHNFCWKCMSPWASGCSAGKLCFPLTIIRDERWGSVPVVREATQVVGITAGVGVGVGVLGVGLGLAAAAAGIAIGLGAPVVIVGGPIYLLGKKIKKSVKNWKNANGLQAMQQKFGHAFNDEEFGELADELKWGIRVYVPWSKTDPTHLYNLTQEGKFYMGIMGRVAEDIFVAYADMGSRLNGSSPPVYIIPYDVSFGAIKRVAGWNMAEVELLSSVSSADALLDSIGDDIQRRYRNCIFNVRLNFRHLPQPKEQAVRLSTVRERAESNESVLYAPYEIRLTI